MDPILNCILAVCCPPLSEGQQEALATFLTREGLDANYAEECAKIMLKHFDLAPAGTLQPFKDAIAELARGAQHKG